MPLGILVYPDRFEQYLHSGGNPNTSQAISFQGQGYEIVGNDIYASGHGIYLGANHQG